MRRITRLILTALLGCMLPSGAFYAQSAARTGAVAFRSPARVSNAQRAIVARAAAQQMRYYSIWLRHVVVPHTDSVFLAITWYVIVAKIALKRSRSWAGGNLVEQLVHFLTAAVKLLFLFFQILQGAIAGLKDSFQQSGRALGVTIVDGTKMVRGTMNDSTEWLPEQIIG